MNNFIITILFGYLGTYRFSKKQNKLGLIYLFTGGLFFVGWFYDIYLSYIEYKNLKVSQDSKTTINEKQEYYNTNSAETKLALETIRVYEENQKKIVYDNVIDVTHTNYDNRQRIIRNLIQNHSMSKNKYGVLLDCKSDIEDGKMMSGKPCVNELLKMKMDITIF